MSEFNGIRAGYQLHLESWENDADNYQTKILDGLTKEEVIAMVNVAKLFYSEHHGGVGGTDYRRGGEEKQHEAYDKVKEILIPIGWMEEDDDYGSISEFVTDQVLGWAGEGFCDGYIRVFESFKIYYFPTAVEEVEFDNLF